MHEEHAISEDENIEETLNDNEVLPELSDDSDKEDDPSMVTGTSTVNNVDVDDPDDPDDPGNHNR